MCFFADRFNGVFRNRSARVAAWKEPVLGMHGFPIAAQDLQQLGRQHHVAILLAFALHDADDHPLAIYGCGLQSNGLRDSQPSGVTDGQNDAMFDELHAAKKMQNLFGAEDKGQLLRLLGKRENLLEGPWPLQRKLVEEAKRCNSDEYRTGSQLLLVCQIHQISADVFRA